jgi:hypothetical protein
MTSKHTPGPWTVDGPAHNQIVWSAPEHRVCFLAHSNGDQPERDFANGQLIAAAPDLLDAAQVCDQFLDHLKNSWEVCHHTQAMMDKLKAAISKAEGCS